jgi:hypothetical protein
MFGIWILPSKWPDKRVIGPGFLLVINADSDSLEDLEAV